jgi:hypothetical protein
MKRLLPALYAATGGLLAALPVAAQAPVGVTSSLERFESFSHVRVTTKLDGQETTASTWRAGMGTNAGTGYSIPRVGLDYAWDSGLSVGLAVAFVFTFEDKLGTDANLLVPRLGYALKLTDTLLLWPRLGLSIHDLTGPDASHTALSLDVPFLYHTGGALGSLTLGPYLDLGLGGSGEDADQTMSEFGAAIGFQFF